MIRHAARGALALVLMAAVLHSAGLGQPATQIKVFYRDAKTGSEKTIDGDDLKATPGGYQVISAGKVTATISPDDIVRIDPGEMPPLERKDILSQITLEKDRKWEPARVIYLDLQKKAKEGKANPKVLQFLEYKVAFTTAKVADDTADDAWEEKAKAAQQMLNDYLISYATGWEVWQLSRMRCRMLVELGNPGEAAATWAKTAKNASVPADLQREAALEEIDCLFRAKQFPEVQDRIAKFPKAEATGPVKDRLALYQAAVKVAEGPKAPDGAALTAWLKPIQDLVDAAKDPAVRAVGYNVMGEVCMFADRPREAMWSYLWVEVVYNQDRDEVAKAMFRLVKSFESQQDEDRAKSYKDKLRRFRGTL